MVIKKIFEPIVMDEDPLEKVPKPFPPKIPNPLPILVGNTIEEILDLLREKERHKTIRKSLEEQRKALETLLNAYQENFNKVFFFFKQDKRTTLNKLLNLIEKALEKENDTALAKLLETLVALFYKPLISEEEYKAILGNAINKVSIQNKKSNHETKLPKKIVW